MLPQPAREKTLPCNQRDADEHEREEQGLFYNGRHIHLFLEYGKEHFSEYHRIEEHEERRIRCSRSSKCSGLTFMVLFISLYYMVRQCSLLKIVPLPIARYTPEINRNESATVLRSAPTLKRLIDVG